MDVAVGSDVGEEIGDVEVELSGDEVSVMIVYDADEVDGVPPPRAPVVVAIVVLGATDGAGVWLHIPLPLESVKQA